MKKQNSIYPKIKELPSNWYLIDATDKVLGRLATEASSLLLGKNSSIFTPGCDINNFLVIINADKVKVTGKKSLQKKYHRHTGYTGNLKTIVYKDLFIKSPEEVIYKAIKGMIPHNKYGSSLMTKVKIYKSDTHPHQAQNPIMINGGKS